MTEDAVAAIIEKTHRGTSSMSLREAAREILFLSASDTAARSVLAQDEPPSSKTPHSPASSEQSSVGWTNWRGGECPLPPGQLVMWRNRRGQTGACKAGDLAGWEWPHFLGASYDIVAYASPNPPGEPS